MNPWGCTCMYCCTCFTLSPWGSYCMYCCSCSHPIQPDYHPSGATSDHWGLIVARLRHHPSLRLILRVLLRVLLQLLYLQNLGLVLHVLLQSLCFQPGSWYCMYSCRYSALSPGGLVVFLQFLKPPALTAGLLQLPLKLLHQISPLFCLSSSLFANLITKRQGIGAQVGMDVVVRTLEASRDPKAVIMPYARIPGAYCRQASNGLSTLCL